MLFIFSISLVAFLESSPSNTFFIVLSIHDGSLSGESLCAFSLNTFSKREAKGSVLTKKIF
jgi:hypothetical protein